MIKRSIQEEDITFVNIYAPTIEASKCIMQILTNIKGEIDSNTIIVGNFNNPPTSMDKSSRQKINKETLALNDTLNQMDLIDILRPFHPKMAECAILSSAHGTFSRMDHLLGHKISLNKFKIEIISSIFSDCNSMKLEINYRKKTEKITNIRRLNLMVLKNNGSGASLVAQWLRICLPMQGTRV